MRLPLRKYGNIALTIITIPLTLYPAQSPLCLLFLVRLGGYIVNSLDCYSYRLIGKLTDFFAVSGVHLPQSTSGLFHFHRSDFSSSLKAKTKVGSTLVKTADLRVNLIIDGAPITSRTHTHSRVDSSDLVFSLSSCVPTLIYSSCL